MTSNKFSSDAIGLDTVYVSDVTLNEVMVTIFSRGKLLYGELVLEV